ncbi:hypothetical protein ACP4OV_020561 [Aristida adscensionis]
MTVDGIESRALLRWLLDRTSPVDMKIHAGPGGTLPITKDTVIQVLGIPRVGGKLPIFEYSDQVLATRNLREELRLGKADQLSIFTLHDIIVEGRTDDISMRSFFMILLNRLLLPSSSWNISGNEIALARHWRTFGNIDWAQIVYNDLCVAVEKWHERDKEKPTWTVYGCSIFFIVYYLDNFDHKHSPEDNFTTPRVKFYDKALIDELTRVDKRRLRDGSETFGQCKFKSWSNTCYAQFNVANEVPNPVEIPVQRPVADRTCPSAIHLPRMTELMAGRISRLNGPQRKLAQEVWLEFDREVEVYVRTMNNCHDRIVQMQLRTAQRFQAILEDCEDGGPRRRVRPAGGSVGCQDSNVQDLKREAAKASGRIPPAAKARRTEKQHKKTDTIGTASNGKPLEDKDNNNNATQPVTSERDTGNDRNPSDGYSNLSAFATIGEASVSHEPGIEMSRYNIDISDTAADFGASQLQSDSLSPLPTQLPPESQLQGTQMERHLDKMYKAHIQQYPPSAERPSTDPEASNETFTLSKFLESHDMTDVDQAMQKGCSAVTGDPMYDVTPMPDTLSELVYDYTPMQPDDQVYAGDEEDNAYHKQTGISKDAIGRRLIHRPARFLSPFKIPCSRTPKCNDSALNLRAFLISPDCELRNTTVMQFGCLRHNAADIKESFGNATFNDNFIIDAFIMCLQDDDQCMRPTCFGYRVFTPVDVAMIVNQEKASKGKDLFRPEALDAALRRSLPSGDRIKDTKLWDTSWSDHHELMEDIQQGEQRPWNKIMIERLNDSFHRVYPRGTLPVFTHWRALPIAGLPKQAPNDQRLCIQCNPFPGVYNGEEGVLTCSSEQYLCLYNLSLLRDPTDHHSITPSSPQAAEIPVPKSHVWTIPPNSPPLKRPKIEPIDVSSDDSDGEDSFFVHVHQDGGNYRSDGDSYPEYSSDVPEFISVAEESDSTGKDYQWFRQRVCDGISDPEDEPDVDKANCEVDAKPEITEVPQFESGSCTGEAHRDPDDANNYDP